MGKAIEGFQERRYATFSRLMNSQIASRERMAPQVDFNEVTESMIDYALKPWMFDNLPGANPLMWPSSLD